MSSYDFSKFEPRAWINALSDEGSKEALVWWLYKTDAERHEQALRVKALEKERGEAERDGARLDWMQQRNDHGFANIDSITSVTVIKPDGSVGNKFNEKPTLREAIDEAMLRATSPREGS